MQNMLLQTLGMQFGIIIIIIISSIIHFIYLLANEYAFTFNFQFWSTDGNVSWLNQAIMKTSWKQMASWRTNEAYHLCRPADAIPHQKDQSLSFIFGLREHFGCDPEAYYSKPFIECTYFSRLTTNEGLYLTHWLVISYERLQTWFWMENSEKYYTEFIAYEAWKKKTF